MKFVLKVILVLKLSFLFSTEYFVAISYGNDENNGTSLATPFKTIEKASSLMSEGDICYIRQGLYHETIFIDNISGSEGLPITLQVF